MVERNGYFPDHRPDREPRREITRVQRLHLELLRLTQFNEMDGQQVAADLEAYPQFWRAAMLGNFGHAGELIALRDMEQDFYNADTLMVLTDEEHMPVMEEMAWRWSADEVGWLLDDDAGVMLGLSPVGRLRVLRVWWT